jgi:hypothetical protein
VRGYMGAGVRALWQPKQHCSAHVTKTLTTTVVEQKSADGKLVVSLCNVQSAPRAHALLPHVLAQARSLEPRETRSQMHIRGCVCVCVQTYVSTSEHAFPRSFCLSWGRTTQR